MDFLTDPTLDPNEEKQDIDYETHPDYCKTNEEKKLLTKALKKIFLFKHLNDTQLHNGMLALCVCV